MFVCFWFDLKFSATAGRCFYDPGAFGTDLLPRQCPFVLKPNAPDCKRTPTFKAFRVFSGLARNGHYSADRQSGKRR